MTEKLKSALDIALEKYNMKPEDLAIVSEEQKARIADIKSFYKARKAELEIMYQQQLKKLMSGPPSDYPALKERADNDYMVDRNKLDNEERDKIKAAREQDRPHS